MLMVMSSCAVRGSDEGRVSGDGPADDERVHVIGALERVDGLGIREVARDAVARGYAELRLTTELDAVTAADLARQRHDLAHPRSDEGLRHCGVVIALLAVILQLRD